jgi:hypothetical protein
VINSRTEKIMFIPDPEEILNPNSGNNMGALLGKRNESKGPRTCVLQL